MTDVDEFPRLLDRKQRIHNERRCLLPILPTCLLRQEGSYPYNHMEYYRDMGYDVIMADPHPVAEALRNVGKTGGNAG